MNSESYKYKPGRTFFDFEFESDGPNGRIKKGIQYLLRNTLGNSYFNIGFGDLDDATSEINDISISNNGDANKILVTIAKNILEFTAGFPDMTYYFKGSTRSRTRLYQISISKNIAEIQKLFELYGRYNDRWELFTLGKNYEAFLFYRKINEC